MTTQGPNRDDDNAVRPNQESGSPEKPANTLRIAIIVLIVVFFASGGCCCGGWVLFRAGINKLIHGATGPGTILVGHQAEGIR